MLVITDSDCCCCDREERTSAYIYCIASLLCLLASPWSRSRFCAAAQQKTFSR